MKNMKAIGVFLATIVSLGILHSAPAQAAVTQISNCSVHHSSTDSGHAESFGSG